MVAKEAFLGLEAVVNYLPRKISRYAEKEMELGPPGRLVGYALGYGLDLVIASVLPVVGGTLTTAAIAVASPALAVYRAREESRFG